MKLKVSKRAVERKSQTKQLRRQGFIPAIVYSKGESGEPVAIVAGEFQGCLRQIPKGRLATTKFTLVSEDGEKKVIVKDIQYNITTYDIIHLDLEELHDDNIVKVNVPIESRGVADCPGIKLGGVLRQVIRSVEVKCLPKNLPEAFVLNVSHMKMSDVLRLSDITFPEDVKPTADLDEVALAITKR